MLRLVRSIQHRTTRLPDRGSTLGQTEAGVKVDLDAAPARSMTLKENKMTVMLRLVRSIQ
jgi:hypothetical protein